jgi:hypothetical protein
MTFTTYRNWGNCAFVFATAFFIVASSIQAAAADCPPVGFRNLKWGEPPTGNLRQVGETTSEGLATYGLSEGKRPEKLFGVPVREEAYLFDKNRLFSGSAYLDGKESFEQMKAEMIRRFGEPAFANARIWLWKWKWKDSPVEISLNYQERFTKTTVTFTDKSI